VNNVIIKKQNEQEPDRMKFEFLGSGLNIEIPAYDIRKGTLSDRIIGECSLHSKAMKCLTMDLLHLPGIESFRIQPTIIIVTKGKAFDWDFIEPMIRSLFEHHKVGDASLFLKKSSSKHEFKIIVDRSEECDLETTYHTNLFISETEHEAFDPRFWKYDKLRLEEHGRDPIDRPIQRIGECGVSILDNIFNKCGGGLAYAVIMPYRLNIKKHGISGLITWDKIDEVVIDTINAARSPMQWGHNLFRG
jgi:hypothetical protein